MDRAQQRLAMLTQLRGALDLAERLHEPVLVYLIERALDETHGRIFTSVPAKESARIN